MSSEMQYTAFVVVCSMMYVWCVCLKKIRDHKIALFKTQAPFRFLLPPLRKILFPVEPTIQEVQQGRVLCIPPYLKWVLSV